MTQTAALCISECGLTYGSFVPVMHLLHLLTCVNMCTMEKQNNLIHSQMSMWWYLHTSVSQFIMMNQFFFGRFCIFKNVFDTYFLLCTGSFWPYIVHGKVDQCEWCTHTGHTRLVFEPTFTRSALMCARHVGLAPGLSHYSSPSGETGRQKTRDDEALWEWNINAFSLGLASQGHLLAFHCWKTAWRLRQLKLKRFPPCPHTN